MTKLISLTKKVVLDDKNYKIDEFISIGGVCYNIII